MNDALLGIFVGALLGIFFGALQFYLLLLGIKSMAGGKLKVWFFVAQFFCPLFSLGLCALFAPTSLVVCACIMSSILIVGAFMHFYKTRKRG